MNISIHAQGFELTDGLRAHTLQRLHFALRWAVRDLKHVQVKLSDINGPKGGFDKRCHVQLLVAHGTDVIIEAIEADLYVAIDHAIERAKQTLVRRRNRQRVSRISFTPFGA
jgi:putative sigma-54 modulation protein